jgi:hypothetical protein
MSGGFKNIKKWIWNINSQLFENWIVRCNLSEIFYEYVVLNELVIKEQTIP